MFYYTEFVVEIPMAGGSFAYLRIKIPIARTRGARRRPGGMLG